MYNIHVQYSQDSYVLMWTMFPTICMEGTSRDVMFVVEWSEATWSDMLVSKFFMSYHDIKYQIGISVVVTEICIIIVKYTHTETTYDKR